MTEYVKIISGESSATMANAEHTKFVELTKANASPGEGWYPVQKAQDKPVPGDGEELAYTYAISGGVAQKTYFLVPKGKRFWRERSIRLYSSDGRPVTIEVGENGKLFIIEEDQ